MSTIRTIAMVVAAHLATVESQGTEPDIA